MCTTFLPIKSMKTARKSLETSTHIYTVKIEVQQIIPLLTTLSVAKRSEQGPFDKCQYTSQSAIRKKIKKGDREVNPKS